MQQNAPLGAHTCFGELFIEPHPQPQTTKRSISISICICNCICMPRTEISRNQTMASFGVRGMGQPLGIRICCCRVCTCINFGFVLSRIGLLKLMQLGLAMLCEGLLIRYGVPYADSIGQALTSFLATTGHCFTTTGILLLCYAFSDKSYSLIRQSLFETLFNGLASCMYFSSSSYMGFACVVWLHPQFLVRPGFWAYPAMTACYYMGYAAGILHALDAYLAFRHFRGAR